jgi:hypothetical protein
MPPGRRAWNAARQRIAVADAFTHWRASGAGATLDLLSGARCRQNESAK